MFVRAENLVVWLLLSAGAGLAGCAAVAPPTGGPRDTTPPRLVATSPDSAARNVSQRFVRLTFSEPVQTKDLSKNLLVTPQLSVDNPYQLREDRNSITLQFDKPLAENTTYSFNFREAIVDITESLPARGVSLSFSTGAVLDSGAVRGTVTDVLSTRPVGEATIGLYRASDTTTVRRQKPYYLARTDKEGVYSLGFLKVGDYKIYAFTDKNQNGIFDDGEKIGYLPAPVRITGQGVDTVNLAVVRPDRRAPRLATRDAGPTALKLGFSEGVSSLVITGFEDKAPSAAELAAATVVTENGRTAYLFKTPAVGEGRYALVATDSTGNVLNDTLSVRFPVPAAASRTAPAPLYAVQGSPRNVYRQGQVVFKFNEPVRLADKQPFGTLIEDSLKTRPLRLPADGTFNENRTQLTVTLNTNAKKQVVILLDSTTLTPISGQPLRPKPVPLAITEQDPTGIISGTIASKEKNFDLQLIDDKYQVVRTLRSPKGKYRFAQLPPGTYRLRALIDADGDGQWRGGDPDLLLPPEPVYLNPKPLQVRANWEIEEKLAF